METSIHLSLSRKRLSNVTRAFLFAIFSVSVWWMFQPANRLDRAWSDLLLANQNQSGSEQIVLVNITANDLLAHGIDRIDRTFLAKSLEIIAESQPTRVLLDCNLGRNLLPDEEERLKSALMQFGSGRIATGYEDDPLMNTKPSLLQNLQLVDLRLIADSDGRFRELRTPKASSYPDASEWLISGKLQRGVTRFDRRINPETFERMSLSDLHSPTFHVDSLRNKFVIVSFDRAAAKSRANLPVHGGVGRGELIAMATNSRLSGYSQLAWITDLIGIVVGISGTIIGFFTGLFSATLRRAAGWALLLGVVLLASMLWGVLYWGIPTQPSNAISMSLLGLYSAFAYRLRLYELFSGLLAGDLSPEEVWLWRTQGDGPAPVVLFNAVGGVKRANQAAREAFQLTAKSDSQIANELAQLCMPQLGKRATRIESENQSRIWDLDWPHESLPIAIFNDVTESVSQSEALRKRLITDPLTGVLNRTGFEERVKRLNADQIRDYAILFMDMNGFKEVNDTHGHEAGDVLLKVAASRFGKKIRAEDTLARLGGDEFAIVLEGKFTVESLLQLRSKLEAELTEPIDIGSDHVFVGVAIGFATADENGMATAEVLRKADAAMYSRKAEIKGKRGVAIPLEIRPEVEIPAPA